MTIAPGASDNFTVRFNVASANDYTRLLSFTNNDANENPYNFYLKATASAATPTFSFNATTKVLTVNGTSGNDFIRGSITSNVLTIRMNSLSQTFANASSISRIVINGLAGNDTISLAQSVNLATSLFGDAGNDTIYGGSGVDIIDGGADFDTAFRTGSDPIPVAEEILA